MQWPFQASVGLSRLLKLKKKDLLGKSDPYVKISLTEDKLSTKKTTVKHSNLNPEWNEELNLVIKDPESRALELIVYDWDKVGKHEKMGMNVVPLMELAPEEPTVITLILLKNMDPNDPLNEKPRGDLIVELTYKPFKDDQMPVEAKDSNDVEKAPAETPPGGGLLAVIVHEAQDVEGRYHTKPYVRLLYRGEERKTKYVKENRDPRWEEEFQFMLEEPLTDNRLHVEVISTSSKLGLLHPKERRGSICSGCGAVRLGFCFGIIEEGRGVAG
ncbi:hypothetical protein MLD38_002142 [Melastoma candidum]|uniref:Uncharacterized protein n=1 Tax=Melastoma candidum TaxID=119954 RepID=A0ACB9SFH0_9MYRT|nr:hypothetical protein MLD38_002142 [Melastoma candidum]